MNLTPLRTHSSGGVSVHGSSYSLPSSPVFSFMQMLVDCHGGRRRRYWCAARDSLVRAMEDHLRKLGRTEEEPLPVERVGTWEVMSVVFSCILFS